MKNMYNLEEQNSVRITNLKEEIKHLSSSIEGLLKKVHSLEKTTQSQQELNRALSDAIEEIAAELEMTYEDQGEA